MMLSAAATRVDEVYDPPNDMEFGVWTASMGRVTNNPDGWDRFYIAIRRADGMVHFMENFKSLLDSQLPGAAGGARGRAGSARMSSNSHTAASHT